MDPAVANSKLVLPFFFKICKGITSGAHIHSTLRDQFRGIVLLIFVVCVDRTILLVVI
ncbi:hypothetical protein MKX03_003790 [Papaver bracteatum]|nr:hypothetical protein MKX03_003790 [Papaver bracteatum]